MRHRSSLHISKTVCIRNYILVISYLLIEKHFTCTFHILSLNFHRPSASSSVRMFWFESCEHCVSVLALFMEFKFDILLMYSIFDFKVFDFIHEIYRNNVTNLVDVCLQISPDPQPYKCTFLDLLLASFE